MRATLIPQETNRKYQNGRLFVKETVLTYSRIFSSIETKGNLFNSAEVYFQESVKRG